MSDTSISRNKRRRMREKDSMIMLNEELVHLRQQMAALKEGSNRSSTEMAELRCTNKQLLDSLFTEQENCQAPRQVSEELAASLEEMDAYICQSATTKHCTSFKDKESETDVESQPDLQISNDDANEKEDLKEENSSLKEAIKELQKQLADERKNNEDNKFQIESLRVKAKTFEDHSTLLAYELHEMTVDRNSLLNALEGKHEKIKTIEAKWKAKVKKMADQHEVKLYDEQVKSYQLRVQNKNLKAELDQVKSELEGQKLQLTVTTFLNDIVNDVEGLVKQREIASLRDHIQQLQFELAQAENVKRLQQHKEEQGAEEYKKLFDQYQIVEQQNQLLEEDNTLLKKRVLVMRQENTEAHEKFLEEQTDRITAKMSFVAQIKQLEENCTSLKEANATLSRDGQRLKHAFERKNQDNDGLMEVIEELMEKVEEKENIIEELQAKKRRGCLRRLLCWR
ncbi:lamin-B1-like [Rhopilema esculentum]|uniref:lamin-B1-like n=1 Tax=Rhopilema esculentum TaxID=499914 RepID=UPI0031CF7D4A|eukprot:gene7515-13296_t